MLQAITNKLTIVAVTLTFCAFVVVPLAHTARAAMLEVAATINSAAR